MAYAGRYIRRLTISQKRLFHVSQEEVVVYQTKDIRTKTVLETRSSPWAFVALLLQHLPDRYRHSMRYFGLLSPRTKPTTSAENLGRRDWAGGIPWSATFRLIPSALEADKQCTGSAVSGPWRVRWSQDRPR